MTTRRVKRGHHDGSGTRASPQGDQPAAARIPMPIPARIPAPRLPAEAVPELPAAAGRDPYAVLDPQTARNALAAEGARLIPQHAHSFLAHAAIPGSALGDSHLALPGFREASPLVPGLNQPRFAQPGRYSLSRARPWRSRGPAGAASCSARARSVPPCWPAASSGPPPRPGRPGWPAPARRRRRPTGTRCAASCPPASCTCPARRATTSPRNCSARNGTRSSRPVLPTASAMPMWRRASRSWSGSSSRSGSGPAGIVTAAGRALTTGSYSISRK